MHRSHTVGGIAALALSALFTLFLLLLAIVLPSQGFGPGELNDPAKGIPFIASSRLATAIIYIGFALAFVPLTLALYHRVHAAAPLTMQLVVWAGITTSTLFLAYAMLNVIGNATVVSVYNHDALTGGAAYVTLRAAANAMSAGALFAAGCEILLAGLAALHTQRMPKVLGAVMLVAGSATLLSFAVLPLGLFGLVLAPIWSSWLGIVLLRATPSASTSSAHDVLAHAS